MVSARWLFTRATRALLLSAKFVMLFVAMAFLQIAMVALIGICAMTFLAYISKSSDAKPSRFPHGYVSQKPTPPATSRRSNHA